MNCDIIHGQFHLPVWKQGDDLGHFLAETDTNAAALKALAGQYRLAAKVCEDMAALCQMHPEIDMDGDTHRISVAAPAAVMDELVAAGLVKPDEFDGETED
jgi:hypothetical protein